MAVSIKDPETDRLARELAAVTGEALTDAIRNPCVSGCNASRTAPRPA